MIFFGDSWFFTTIAPFQKAWLHNPPSWVSFFFKLGALKYVFYMFNLMIKCILFLQELEPCPEKTSWNNILDLNSYKNLPIPPGSTWCVKCWWFFNSWIGIKGGGTSQKMWLILLMEEIWLTSAYPITCRVLFTSQVVVWDSFHQQYFMMDSQNRSLE